MGDPRRRALPARRAMPRRGARRADALGFGGGQGLGPSSWLRPASSAGLGAGRASDLRPARGRPDRGAAVPLLVRPRARRAELVDERLRPRLDARRRHGGLRRGRAARVRHRRDRRGRGRGARRAARAPRSLGRDGQDAGGLFRPLLGDGRRRRRTDLAARCALELALPRRLRQALRALGAAPGSAPRPRPVVVYDAVLPFSSPRKLAALARADPGARHRTGEDQGRRRPRARAATRSRCCAACSARGSTCASTRTAPGRRRRGARRDRAHARASGSAPSSSRCRRRPRRARARVTAETPEIDHRRRVAAHRSRRRAELARARAPATRSTSASRNAAACCRRCEIARHRARGTGSSASSAPRSARAGSSPPPAATSPRRSRPRYVEGSGGRLLLKEDLTAERVLPGCRGLGAAVRRARASASPSSEESLERHTHSSRTIAPSSVAAEVGRAPPRPCSGCSARG